MAEKKVNNSKATASNKKEKPKMVGGKLVKHPISAKCIANQRDKLSDTYTKTGKRLTIKEAKFVDAYITSGNIRQAAIDAGYKCGKDVEFAGQIGTAVLEKAYIREEIDNRMQASKKKSIADRQEIMEFWSAMMRGEILDQFDLPTTNGDKLKAASELAKRNIDIEDRIKERNSTQATAPEIRIKLDWGGDNSEK